MTELSHERPSNWASSNARRLILAAVCLTAAFLALADFEVFSSSQPQKGNSTQAKANHMRSPVWDLKKSGGKGGSGRASIASGSAAGTGKPAPSGTSAAGSKASSANSALSVANRADFFDLPIPAPKSLFNPSKRNPYSGTAIWVRTFAGAEEMLNDVLLQSLRALWPARRMGRVYLVMDEGSTKDEAATQRLLERYGGWELKRNKSSSEWSVATKRKPAVKWRRDGTPGGRRRRRRRLQRTSTQRDSQVYSAHENGRNSVDSNVNSEVDRDGSEGRDCLSLDASTNSGSASLAAEADASGTDVHYNRDSSDFATGTTARQGGGAFDSIIQEGSAEDEEDSGISIEEDSDVSSGARRRQLFKIPSSPTIVNYLNDPLLAITYADRDSCSGRYSYCANGYHMQQRDTFMADAFIPHRFPGSHSDEEDNDIIGIADSDALLTTLPHDHTYFDEAGRPRVIPRVGLPIGPLWDQSAQATEFMLGKPEPFRGMSYFPVYFYRRHFKALRDHVEKLHNKSFDAVFSDMVMKGFYSQFNVMTAYAFHFHKDEYSWHYFTPEQDNGAPMDVGTLLNHKYPGVTHDWSFLNDTNATQPYPRTWQHWKHHKHKDAPDAHMTKGYCRAVKGYHDLCRKGYPQWVGPEWRGGLEPDLFDWEYASWGGRQPVHEAQRRYYDAVWDELEAGCCWDTELLGNYIWQQRKDRLAKPPKA